MAINWEVGCVELLRVMINDLEDSPTYSDGRLKRLLVSAAFQVVQAATFAQVFSVDLVEQTITPDPTDEDTIDNHFVELMCLKAACIIDMGKAIKAAGKAVSGMDMKAVSFDLTGVSDAAIELLKSGYCSSYKEILTDYVYGTGNLGQVVMGPIRLYARGFYGRR